MKIKIADEVLEVKRVFSGGYLPLLVCGNREYYVAEDSESAGEAAREYWEDMAQDDPKEFCYIIGEKRLVQWGMGLSDKYGFDCMQDFLDATARVPEEQWAGYDGNELDVAPILMPDGPPEGNDDTEIYDEELADYQAWQELLEELGFTPTVAYRHN